MHILELIRKAQLTLDLLLVTIIIIPFQVLLLFSTVVLSESPETFAPHLGIGSIPNLVSYFILTIVYCTITSLLFRPKRIVSPVNIQIGTVVSISLILIYRMMTVTNPQTLSQAATIIGNLTFSIAFLTMILIIAGAYQLFVVDWLVGLNFIGLEQKTFSISGNMQTVVNNLEFLTLRGYKKHLGSNEEIIYKKRTNDQVIISLGSGSDDNSSTLATTAFHKGNYSIESSKKASQFRDSAIFELSARLAANNSSIKLTEIDAYDDPVSICARNWVNSYKISKIPNGETFESIIESISTFYRIVIGITIFTLIGLSAAYWTNFSSFDFNTYITLTVGLIVALLIEIGIPLRDEVLKKKTMNC